MDGFIPFSRAPFVMDLLVMAMLCFLPVLGWSVYAIKVKRDFRLHRFLQIALGIILLLTIGIFEYHVRLYGWRQHAQESPYFSTWLFPFLYLHLVLATVTVIIWTYTTFQAIKDMIRQPSVKSRRLHMIIGKASAAGMLLTTVTGWIFYYLAFVA